MLISFNYEQKKMQDEFFMLNKKWKTTEDTWIDHIRYKFQENHLDYIHKELDSTVQALDNLDRAVKKNVSILLKLLN